MSAGCVDKLKGCIRTISRIKIYIYIAVVLPVFYGTMRHEACYAQVPSFHVEVGEDESVLQDKKFELHVGSFKKFFEEKVFTILPLDFKEKFSPYSITLYLTSYCPSDGLFIDPSTTVSGGEESSKGQKQLWLCMKPSLFWDVGAFPILAHEIFHAVHYVVHPNEEAWIREGLAQWFEFRVTQAFNSPNLIAALENPSTPLISSYFPGKTPRKQYGHDLLYIYYLWSHCGGDELIWKIARGYEEHQGRQFYGAQGIDEQLKLMNEESVLSKNQKVPTYCQTFERSAVSFEVAKVHNKKNYQGDTENPYYLLATALKGVESLKQLPSEIDGVALKDLGPFTPIILAGDIQIDDFVSQKFHLFWLDSRFPFVVREVKPIDSLSRWSLLLIKK